MRAAVLLALIPLLLVGDAAAILPGLFGGRRSAAGPASPVGAGPSLVQGGSVFTSKAEAPPQAPQRQRFSPFGPSEAQRLEAQRQQHIYLARVSDEAAGRHRAHQGRVANKYQEANSEKERIYNQRVVPIAEKMARTGKLHRDTFDVTAAYDSAHAAAGRRQQKLGVLRSQGQHLQQLTQGHLKYADMLSVPTAKMTPLDRSKHEAQLASIQRGIQQHSDTLRTQLMGNSPAMATHFKPSKVDFYRQSPQMQQLLGVPPAAASQHQPLLDRRPGRSRPQRR